MLAVIIAYSLQLWCCATVENCLPQLISFYKAQVCLSLYLVEALSQRRRLLILAFKYIHISSVSIAQHFTIVIL